MLKMRITVCRNVLPLIACALALACSLATATGERLSHPDVDAYNVRMGTQTFGVKYQFTTNTTLVETAQAIREIGSDILKFYLGRGLQGQYGISVPAYVTNLASLAEYEPSCRAVLDMPFRHILAWSYVFSLSGDTPWRDGYSASERQKEYNEIYAFTRYLLTNYTGSGKSFYLGHWEGDWYLLPNYNTTVNPSSVAIQGMIDWLNNRQAAVDDAMRDVPHTNVFVYHYTEVNRVRDAMVNGASNNQRLVNAVLPSVTNLDYVSWSSYDGMDLAASDLYSTLNYIERCLPTNKASVISGKRVFVGEYGWGGTLTSAAQEAPTRAYCQRLLQWGVPFMLFWEMYNNEPNKQYWLVDTNNVRVDCWYLHQRFINAARIEVAKFREKQGRVPSATEFTTLARPLLNQPIPAPVPLWITNVGVVSLTSTSAIVRCTLGQGIYGDEGAGVRLMYGRSDGGTNSAAWETVSFRGANTNFNPTIFEVTLTNLEPKARYYFRFQATNSTGEIWAPVTRTFSTDIPDLRDFGAHLKIQVVGYQSAEVLADFPVLVTLGNSRAEFSYSGFASPTGEDLLFTDATGSEVLPHEIDQWNTNGVSTVWVRVPEMRSYGTVVRAHWGNPGLAAALHTNGVVWPPPFELVWHLRENGFPYADSAHNHPGLSGDAPTGTTAGLVGRAVTFNGSSDYLNAGAFQLGNQCTLSAWVKLDRSATNIQTVLANKLPGSTTSGFALFINSYQTADGKVILETGNGGAGAVAATGTGQVPVDQWTHVATVIDRSAGTARLYVNGMDRTVTSNVHTGFNIATNVLFGRFAGSGYPFRGTMDEVRIRAGLSSAGVIRAEAKSISSSDPFLSYESVSRDRPAVGAIVEDSAVTLRWPASGVGYIVQTCTNLGTDAVWVQATNQPSLSGTNWEVRLSPGQSAQSFFRLRSI
jgi:hypothetical protein